MKLYNMNVLKVTISLADASRLITCRSGDPLDIRCIRDDMYVTPDLSVGESLLMCSQQIRVLSSSRMARVTISNYFPSDYGSPASEGHTCEGVTPAS